jgi:acetyltransferase-like isoleucine patch superfamily enzyme
MCSMYMDDYMKATRQTQGFLGAEEAVTALGENNTIFDPYSLLISEGVTIGVGNVFYPNVVIERRGDGKLVIGDDNVFYPGTYILSSAGSISIGSSSEFGTGGCTIKATLPDILLTIGDGGRYCDGATIMGKTSLGSGSQILGNITVQGCSLAAGGTFQEPDPDERAAVLKGFGLARDIMLEKGQVVNGSGNFAEQSVEWQHDYHPKPKV